MNSDDTSLRERIDVIECKIDKILEKLENVSVGTEKMSSHIDFIDGVYNRVRAPLYWICDRVNTIKDYRVSYTEKQLQSSSAESSVCLTVNQETQD